MVDQKLDLTLIIGKTIDQGVGNELEKSSQVYFDTVTVDQIRHCTDLIVYCVTNPSSSHPRYMDRYTTFTEEGFEKSELNVYVQTLKAKTSHNKVVKKEVA